MPVNSAREDELIRDVSKKETLVRLYKYMLAYKKELTLVGFLLFITLSVNLATPLMIELAVDTYVAEGDVPGLLKLAAVGFSMFLLSGPWASGVQKRLDAYHCRCNKPGVNDNPKPAV